jgi:hypothetical protein
MSRTRNNAIKGQAEITSDLVTINFEWQGVSGSKPQTTVMEIQMKFLGSDCDNLKPPGRETKQAQASTTAAQK